MPDTEVVTKVTNTEIKLSVTSEKVIPLARIVKDKKDLEEKLKQFEAVNLKHRQDALDAIAKYQKIIDDATAAGVIAEDPKKI